MSTYLANALFMFNCIIQTNLSEIIKSHSQILLKIIVFIIIIHCLFSQVRLFLQY